MLFAAVDHKVGEVNWFPATFIMPVDRGYRTQLHVFIFVMFQSQVCWTAHKYWVIKKNPIKISYIDTQQSYLILSNYWNCECQSAINGIGSQLAIKNVFCTSKTIWHGKAIFICNHLYLNICTSKNSSLLVNSSCLIPNINTSTPITHQHQQYRQWKGRPALLGVRSIGTQWSGTPPSRSLPPGSAGAVQTPGWESPRISRSSGAASLGWTYSGKGTQI